MADKIYMDKDYSEKLIIKDKLIEDLELGCCSFKESVSIINCKIKNAMFFDAYFLNGLLIENCEFLKELNFSEGYHVNDKALFRLENVIFHGFTDFQGYLFGGRVKFVNVNFKSGTNLLGNINTPVEVRFTYKPVFINVVGEMDINNYN